MKDINSLYMRKAKDKISVRINSLHIVANLKVLICWLHTDAFAMAQGARINMCELRIRMNLYHHIPRMQM